MHTEEVGVAIQSQPNQVYDVLFPQDKTETFANASSVAPAIVQDVIIPLEIPGGMEAGAMSDELQAVAVAVHSIAVPPTENAYAETVKTESPKVQNIAKRM